MIGVIIVGHGELANSIFSEVERIIGKQQNIVAISFANNESLEDLEKKIVSAYEKVNSDEGVLILVDMFGGSPSNIALKLMQKYENIETITGFNFPMLLEFITKDKFDNLKSFKEKLLLRGKEAIVDLKEKLLSRKPCKK